MPMTSSPPRPPSSLPAPFSALLSRLRRHPTWIDGGIAAIVLFLDILTVIMVVQSSDHDLQQGFPGLLPGAVTTSLLGAIALTLRRRFPLQAWLTILFVTPLFELAAIAIYDLTPIEARLASGLHSALWMVGLPIMLGTLAVRLRPCRTWMAGLVTLIVVTLSQTLLEEIHGGELTYQITVTGLLYSTGILVGLNTRSHRLRLVDAQLRSERLALEREQAALLAAANERSRIAREMHDVVAHSLAVMITMADGVTATIDRNPAMAKEALEVLAETGRTALADTRRLVGVLREDPAVAGLATPAAAEPAPSAPPPEADRAPGRRPRRRHGKSRTTGASASSAGSGSFPTVRKLPVPEFAPPGTVAPREPSAPIENLRRLATDTSTDRSTGATPLAPAPEQTDLSVLVQRFTAAGIPVTYTWNGDPLPSDKSLQLALFRIAQESLTNILRYAPTTPAVRVAVERHVGTVVLTVDNVAAPGSQPMHGSGKGLIGMRERAAVYGGTVQAGPTPTGWRVYAVLRWDENNEGTPSWQMPQ